MIHFLTIRLIMEIQKFIYTNLIEWCNVYIMGKSSSKILIKRFVVLNCLFPS